MRQKLIFGLSFVLLSFSSMAQDSSSEIPESCLKVPETVAMHPVAPLEFRFVVELECEINDYSIQVFNLDGSMIFESNDPKNYWNASDVAAGDYMYTISGVMGSAVAPKRVSKKGKVTVVR